MNEWTDTELIRQWWYLYLQVLRGPCFGGKAEAEFDGVSLECERRGIIREGCLMTRNGAEDLAGQCDDYRNKRR